jgi:hypothetical protein
VQANRISIYLTILFAYLTAAYLAGKNLTRFQLVRVQWPIVLWSTGIVASLVFMWSARRAKTE